MSRKAFQQLNIIPPSLSAISNNPDISSNSFTGIFQQRNNSKQSYNFNNTNFHQSNINEQSQYKIKIKKPSDKMYMSRQDKNHEIEVVMVSDSDQENRQHRIQAEVIPLNENITGYQICKQSFSEEQIIQAFKVIDINKDQVITQEDIMFFLQYIKEPYTKQEIKEMISMISSDKKKVTFDDFKKIGKGSIIPFADIRIPDEKTIQKNLIYQNIKNNPTLYNEDSSILINAARNDVISLRKFEQSKKMSKPTEYENIKVINQQEQFQILQDEMPLYDEEQFQKKKQLFNMVEMVNVTEIIKNYQEFINKNKQSLVINNIQRKQNEHGNNTVKYLTIKEISKLLQINQKQTKSLFPILSEQYSLNSSVQKNNALNNILAKRVILQTIAFSPLSKVKKLEMGIIMMLKKKTINFKQLYFLLQILRGQDSNESIKKKLLTILKSKNISKNDQIDKFYALEILSNKSFNLNF